MKKLFLLGAAVILLSACSDQKSEQETKQEQSEQQIDVSYVLPMKEIEEFAKIELTLDGLSDSSLEEQQKVSALANYPHLAELPVVLAYIAEVSMKKIESQDNSKSAYIWYQQSMKELLKYMEEMRFEGDLSLEEQQEYQELFKPWLAKISDTNDMLAYELEHLPNDVTEKEVDQTLEDYSEDIMITALVLSQNINYQNNYFYGEATVSHFTQQGFDYFVKLDSIVQNIQANYQTLFSEEIQPYSASSSYAYLTMLSKQGDPPAGYLFDYTEDSPMFDDTNVTSYETVNNNAIYVSIPYSSAIVLLENNAHIRAQPSIDAPIIYKGSLNEKLVYEGHAYETPVDGRLWYEVTVNGQLGYVSSKVGSLHTVEEMHVGGSSVLITGLEVNIRLYPAIDAPVIYEAVKGQVFVSRGDAFRTNDGRLWYEIVVNGEIGFVSSKFAKPQ